MGANITLCVGLHVQSIQNQEIDPHKPPHLLPRLKRFNLHQVDAMANLRVVEATTRLIVSILAHLIVIQMSLL